MANAIRELHKDLMDKHRLKSCAETCFTTIDTAATTTTTTTGHPNTPAPFTTPGSMPIHSLIYHVPTDRVSVTNKFDGTQGVKAKVFSTPLRLYTISNAHQFLVNQSKLVFEACTTPAQQLITPNQWPPNCLKVFLLSILSSQKQWGLVFWHQEECESQESNPSTEADNITNTTGNYCQRPTFCTTTTIMCPSECPSSRQIKDTVSHWPLLLGP